MLDKISERRLQRIVEIIHAYDCGKPLHLFLKGYFRSHPEMGSTDRRITSSGIYNYFRLGTSLNTLPVEEKITVAHFICQFHSTPFVDFLLNNYSFFSHGEITFPLERKKELVRLKYPEFSPENIFPYKEHLSSLVNFENFVSVLFVQPKVWIRVKINYISEVIKELKEKNIQFESTKEFPLALSLESNTKLQELTTFKKGYFEIQDLSSQKTGNYMRAGAGEEWWDCCAGAGGKSLMLKDKFPEIKLLATDIRASILQNLELRFKKAEIKNYSTRIVDLGQENLPVDKLFDGIICDVPCSGSGTWARTPENISCFNEEKIVEYQQKQKNIVLKASSHLKSNGKLFYITCSVFKEENEDVVLFIQQNSDLKLKEMNLIDGTTLRADSLFVAVLQ